MVQWGFYYDTNYLNWKATAYHGQANVAFLKIAHLSTALVLDRFALRTTLKYTLDHNYRSFIPVSTFEPVVIVDGGVDLVEPMKFRDQPVLDLLRYARLDVHPMEWELILSWLNQKVVNLKQSHIDRSTSQVPVQIFNSIKDI